MQRLEFRTDPKGTLKSPIRKGILAWLREHGPASADAVRAGLLAGQSLTWLMLDQQHPRWAEDHTYYLFYTGHLQRDKPAGGGAPVYRVAEAKASVSASTPARNVAGPRQVQRLYGPLLQGADAPPAREGAQDYAAIPSLVLGQRVPYMKPPRSPAAHGSLPPVGARAATPADAPAVRAAAAGEWRPGGGAR